MPRRAMKKGVKVLDKELLAILPEMVGVLNDEVEALEYSSRRVSIAIWVLVFYQVVVTASFLLLLYGNQYLIK